MSFAARDERVTGLLGPNGAGKSTTLRMIYGLLKPDAGDIQINGTNVHADPLQPSLSSGCSRWAWTLCKTAARTPVFRRAHGPDQASRETRAQSLIDQLDMSGIADRKVEGFSQGERMKVCLGRALIHSPRNVVLDEPTNGLDVAGTRKVREMINRLRDEGLTVLFSSHLMHEVSRLCDDIVIINQGKVIANGTPDEIRSQGGSDQLEDAFLNLLEASYEHYEHRCKKGISRWRKDKGAAFRFLPLCSACYLLSSQRRRRNGPGRRDGQCAHLWR